MFLKRFLDYLNLNIWGLFNIILGSLIMSFTLVNIHLQSFITEGGVLGMSVFLYRVFNINSSITSPILDFICLLLGFKLLGKLFLKRTILISLIFASSYKLFLTIGPFFSDFYQRPLAASILGGIGIGIGCGLIISQGGAAGGDDGLALVISNVFNIKISWAYLFTDLTVLLLSLLYIPFSFIIYSLLTTLISSFLIGQFNISISTDAMNSFDQTKKA